MSFLLCLPYDHLAPVCKRLCVRNHPDSRSSEFDKFQNSFESPGISWNLPLYSPFSPEIFSTWLVECTGALAMAHIADVPRQGPHISDRMCVEIAMKCSMKCSMKCDEWCWPCWQSICVSATSLYYLYISSFICLKAFPENWLVTVQHCGNAVGDPGVGLLGCLAKRVRIFPLHHYASLCITMHHYASLLRESPNLGRPQLVSIYHVDEDKKKGFEVHQGFLPIPGISKMGKMGKMGRMGRFNSKSAKSQRKRLYLRK